MLPIHQLLGQSVHFLPKIPHSLTGVIHFSYQWSRCYALLVYMHYLSALNGVNKRGLHASNYPAHTVVPAFHPNSVQNQHLCALVPLKHAISTTLCLFVSFMFFSFFKHLLVHLWLFYFLSLSFPPFIILCTALISIVFNSFSSPCIYRPPLHLSAGLCTLSFLAGQFPAFQCFLITFV